jgi:hypothetical protein
MEQNAGSVSFCNRPEIVPVSLQNFDTKKEPRDELSLTLRQDPKTTKIDILF